MRWLPISLAALSLSTFAAAQDDAPDPEEARSRAHRTIDCLERVNRDLETTTRLLREAARQTRASDPAARQDAARMVVSLQQRVADLARATKQCVPEEAHLEPQTRIREPTGNEAAVREANDLPSVERDAQLTSNVHAEIGQRVDGTGNVPDDAIKRGIRGIAPRLERCYERLVDRGALQSGRLELAFTVTTSGRVRRVSVENSSLGSRSFNRCVQAAGRRIRPGAGASGGDTRYSYVLHFGPR
jgi:TonB family protein